MLAAPADWDAITVNSKRPVPMLRAFLCSGASTLLNICANFHKKRKAFSNLMCVVDKPYYIYVPLGCKDAIMDALCKHCEMFMTPSTNSELLLRQPHVMVANDFVRVMEQAGINRCWINFYGQKCTDFEYMTTLMKLCRSGDEDCVISYDIGFRIGSFFRNLIKEI